MKKKPINYLTLLLNPLELLRTKKVLHVNPTVPSSRVEPVNSRIFVYDYDGESLEEKELKQVSECYPFINTDKVTWINVDGLKKADVEILCAHYNLHYLIIEDILSLGQRPKMDEINGLVFCVLNMLYFNKDQASVESEQISIVLGKNFVISFQEDATRDVFNPLRERLRILNSKVRQNGGDFLFYSLVDLIVDNYFIVMEKLGDHIESLEEEIIRQAGTRTLANINVLRKEMIVLKRNIGPVREMVGGILRSDSPLIEDRTEKYFKDVYDHIIQANDLAENYRDMMMNLQDLYLSQVNLKMNEVMKVMAIVTCLLAPATVIGGIFGMNFDRIPYLHHQYGFYIAVALMTVFPVGMLWLFRKRGWF